MDIRIFIEGLIIGFSIAAPVGPIGLLCIQRTLTLGRLTGLLSGLGAATADALYGCVAGFGLSIVANLLIEQQLWLGLLGGSYLIYLGSRTVKRAPTQAVPRKTTATLTTAYASTLLLTLTNPATILSFIAVFTGLGLAQTSNSYLSASTLVLGVFIGSALWWVLLSTGVSLLRHKFSPAWLGWVNKIAGSIIIAFGISLLLRLVL